MAVIGRKRKSGIVYFVALRQHGRLVWQRSGADEREAKRLEARMKKEIKAGTFGRAHTGATLVRTYLRSWLDARKVRSADTEATHIEDHVLTRAWFTSMRMEDVRTHHAERLVEEWKSTISKATEERLSPKYVANIFGTVHTAFRSALRRGIIDKDPFDLERGVVPRGGRRTRTPYGKLAIRTLLTSVDVSHSARVFAALAILTGMREGEICGRTWKDWDREAAPLTSLTVDTQYNGQPLKTAEQVGDKPRRIPVHPMLEKVLTWWWDVGFELVHLRRPTLADPIVPASDGEHHTRSSAYKMWRKALTKAGVDNLSLHSTRHTFITLCRRGGARDDVLERVTHNARGTMIDQYTHFDWDPLCESVLCLNVDADVDAKRPRLTATVEALGIEHRAHRGIPQETAEDGGDPAADEPPAISGESSLTAAGVAAGQRGWSPAFLAWRARVSGGHQVVDLRRIGELRGWS